MVKTTFELEDKLDESFRRMAYERKGFKKGALSDSINEAIKDWMAKNYDETERKKGKK